MHIARNVKSTLAWNIGSRIKMNWHSWLSQFRIVVACLGFCVLPVANSAMAQTPELLTAVTSNHLPNPSPAQTKAIERLQKRPTTEAFRLVTVNIDALKGDATHLDIPSMATLSLSKRSEEFRSPSDFTWYGTSSEVPGQATLVVHNGNITGSIQGQGALYRIEPVGNGIHALIKVDTARLPQEHPPSFQDREKRGEIKGPSEESNGSG